MGKIRYAQLMTGKLGELPNLLSTGLNSEMISFFQHELPERELQEEIILKRSWEKSPI